MFTITIVLPNQHNIFIFKNLNDFKQPSYPVIPLSLSHRIIQMSYSNIALSTVYNSKESSVKEIRER